MKKHLSLILALIMVLSTFTPAFGTNDEKELYEQAGEILKNIGVLEGSKSGDLMLNNKLKRQDMVVLISRLYKQEDKAKNYKGKNPFVDVTDSFYIPYIAWAVNKNLIVGMTPSRFGFNEYVTVQQLQTVLLRVLGYGEEAENPDNVSNTAESLGIMSGLTTTPRQEVQRGLMAAMTINALNLNMKGTSLTLAQHLNLNIPNILKVNEVATVDRNTLKLEGKATGVKNLKVSLKPLSTDTSIKERILDIPLNDDSSFSIEIPNLQKGQYEYKFLSENLSTNPKTITIKDIPFEILDVKASNLKEIAINFTKSVDWAYTLFPGNYYTNGGEIESLRLEDDDTTVVLTLKEAMKNNKDYKLSINRVKSKDGEEIEAKDKEFTAYDNEPPSVNKLKPLGDKGLRVYLSEPVKSPRASNFKIDGKKITGQVEQSENIVTIKYLSSYYAPKEGQHILTVTGLEDYAGYKGLDQDIDFNIIKDTEAPKIIDGAATLDQVIIQFDKEIDPDSISKNNFYWKTGHSKRYASKAELFNDKLILNFTGNNLPTNEVSIYIDNVADYWGNQLKNEEIKLKPEIDKTPPEVLGLKVSEDGKSIRVYYSKNVEAKNRAFYSIKDRDNRTVNIKDIEGSGREYTIHLYAPLPVGINTITIQDVYDTTPLKNKLIPYVHTIDMEDVEKPTIESYSGEDRQIILIFSKEMDQETLENYENYLIKLEDKLTYLPKDTDFTLLDGKTLMIYLPEKINGKLVSVGYRGNIKEMQISGLRGINGVLMDPTPLKFTSDTTGTAKAEKAELIEPNTIKVTFNQPIVYAHPGDFSISGRRVYDVEVDFNREVLVFLDDNDETTIKNNLYIERNNSIETALNTRVSSQTISIEDKVPPRIKSNTRELYTRGNEIELPFTEPLDSRAQSIFGEDLEILRLEDGHILEYNEYSTYLKSRDSSILIIEIKNPPITSDYRIRLIPKPKYIRDTNGNIVEEDMEDYFTDGSISR